METFHHLNIAVHVIAGSIALLAGLMAILAVKGSKRHIHYGWYFTRLIVIVIATALIGVFVFKRNTFLLVVTMLSAYNAFSGIRAIRLRGRKPEPIDYVMPGLTIASALYYLYYIHRIGFIWAPGIVYSTVGGLFIVVIYDFCKAFIPVHVLNKAFLYEHIYKMMGAFIAITSAFSGTVFPQYKPYSQFMPSVIGFGYIFFIFIRLSYKSAATKNAPVMEQFN